MRIRTGELRYKEQAGRGGSGEELERAVLDARESHGSSIGLLAADGQNPGAHCFIGQADLTKLLADKRTTETLQAMTSSIIIIRRQGNRDKTHKCFRSPARAPRIFCHSVWCGTPEFDAEYTAAVRGSAPFSFPRLRQFRCNGFATAIERAAHGLDDGGCGTLRRPLAAWHSAICLAVCAAL